MFALTSSAIHHSRAYMTFVAITGDFMNSKQNFHADGRDVRGILGHFLERINGMRTKERFTEIFRNSISWLEATFPGTKQCLK